MKPSLAALEKAAYAVGPRGRRRRRELPAAEVHDIEAILASLSARLSARTLVEYRGVLAHFRHLCGTSGRVWTEVASVRWYLGVLAEPRRAALRHGARGATGGGRGPGRGAASLRVAVAAINAAYAELGMPPPKDDPGFRAWLRGLLASVAAPAVHATPMLADDLRNAVLRARQHPNPLIGARDAALLLLGWSAALRRSDLVAVRVEDLRDTGDGAILHLPALVRATRRRQPVVLPTAADPAFDAVRACRAWLAAAGVSAGPMFRAVNRGGAVGDEPLTGEAVAAIVRRCAEEDDISVRSLRSGWLHQAALAGCSTASMRQVTRHRAEAGVERLLRPGRAAAPPPPALL